VVTDEPEPETKIFELVTVIPPLVVIAAADKAARTFSVVTPDPLSITSPFSSTR
jgi:hypothetical protein